MTSGAIVVLTLLFLAPLFSDLPKPVLAALIIEAVVMGMMNVPELRRLARVQKFDFWVAVTAIVGTLAFGVLAGVVFGVGLSLLWLVSVTTRPALPLLGRSAGTTVFRELSEYPEDEQIPGVAVIRLEGGLFFATSDALDERVRQVIQQTPDVACVVLDCSAINFVDSQGAAELAEIVTIAQEEHVTLRLARLKPGVSATLARDGILSTITTARIHPSVEGAVQAQLGVPPASTEPTAE